MRHKYVNNLVDNGIITQEKAVSLEKDLLMIKEILTTSSLFPKSLTGACNISSILVGQVLEKYSIDSYIINNSKHAFNVI